MEKKMELVKVRVLKSCNDRETKATYEVGVEIELSKERADAALAAELVEIVVVPEI